MLPQKVYKVRDLVKQAKQMGGTQLRSERGA